MNQFTGKGTTIVCKENDGDARQSSSLGFAWRMLLGTIRKTFPQAEQLRTSSLAAWLEDENRKKTVLLLVGRKCFVFRFEICGIHRLIPVRKVGSDRCFLFGARVNFSMIMGRFQNVLRIIIQDITKKVTESISDTLGSLRVHLYSRKFLSKTL